MVYCARCGSDCEWVTCEECGGDGFSHHDCGEDCCCCACPKPNVICDICCGEGGWWVCPMAGCEDIKREEFSTTEEGE